MNTHVVFGKKMYLGSLALTTSVAGVLYFVVGVSLQVLCAVQQRMNDVHGTMTLTEHVENMRTTSIQMTIIVCALALGWLVCSILLFSTKEIRLLTLRKQRLYRQYDYHSQINTPARQKDNASHNAYGSKQTNEVFDVARTTLR